MPSSIGLMAMALVTSALLLLVDRFGWLPLQQTATGILERIAFSETLLHGMLGVLLFAGALHIDINELREHRAAVGILALGSTLISTGLIATLAFVLLPYLGLPISFGYCLLFGAVIAPTDPIGVLALLKQARIPKSLQIQIAGESLFNDGVGVVVFLAVLGAVTSGENVTTAHLALSFAREAGGGVLFGLATGYVAYRLLRSIDHYQTELLITLALVLGGYAVAERLHISAPIAAVVSGLLIGNLGRSLAMSDVTRDHLDKFWLLIDDILNTVLFVLMGFELLRLTLDARTAVAGALVIPIVLFARFTSVALPIRLFQRWAQFAPGAIPILTWGGLRGGISVALALSIPMGKERDLVVTMTYFVVVFSVLVQGLTLQRFARRWSNASATPATPL